MKTNRVIPHAALAGTFLLAVLLLSPRVCAHCDMMAGPVILAVKAARASGAHHETGHPQPLDDQAHAHYAALHNN
jgi:hypothetical protein